MMMASHAPKIGFMMTAVGAEGDDDASWYRQLIADAELGASLGFDAGWIVEHHFSDYQPTPNTLLMLVARRGALSDASGSAPR